MEYTNDILKKMLYKQKLYNKKYSKYFYKMYLEESEKNFISRSKEINDCMNYWEWDLYEKNKILDLKKVNRCKSRFCPNCKLLDISKFIHKFKEILNVYMQDYNFYFLTLTIPSIEASELNNTLFKLNKCFAKLKEMYSYPKYSSKGNKNRKAYQNRLIDIAGGIRVLEITYNYKNGYHPHYHIVIMTKDPIPRHLLVKNHLARFSKKRNKLDFKNEIERQISRKWAELWYNTKVSENEYKLSETYFDIENKYKVLEVDLREFDEKGIYETLKYTFKDTDISSYKVFKELYYSLKGKRLRQGFGVLYNVKIDDDELEVGEQQELLLEFDEDPINIITKGIKELITTYKEYKKISRKQIQINTNIEE